jgi:hypothetical protein
MKTAKNSAAASQSRSGRQIATNDDAAANAQEVEQQIEEETVDKAARQNQTPAPIQIVRSNHQIATADNAVAAREEVEEQAEESRVDKVAFEDGVSTVSAKEYIRGRTHA